MIIGHITQECAAVIRSMIGPGQNISLGAQLQQNRQPISIISICCVYSCDVNTAGANKCCTSAIAIIPDAGVMTTLQTGSGAAYPSRGDSATQINCPNAVKSRQDGNNQEFIYWIIY